MIVLSKMLIAATIGAGAMLAGAANNNTKAPNSNKAGSAVFDENTKYFEFIGENGEENLPSEWEEITPAQYSLNPCNNNVRGCVLATTSVTGDSLSGFHPAIIPVEIDPNNSENMSPKVDQTNVQEVRNRVQDYATE